MDKIKIKYNKDYYTKHKEDIKAKLSVKVECPNCKHMFRHQFLKKHMTTNKCKSVSFDNLKKDMKADDMPDENYIDSIYMDDVSIMEEIIIKITKYEYLNMKRTL